MEFSILKIDIQEIQYPLVLTYFIPPTILLSILKISKSVKLTGLIYSSSLFITMTCYTYFYTGSTHYIAHAAFLVQVFVFLLGPYGIIFALVSTTLAMMVMTKLELKDLQNMEETFGISECEIRRLRVSFLHYLGWFGFFSLINEFSHQQLLDTLLLSSRHKTDFVARMSHELRTPLFGIIGCLDIMEKLSSKDLEEDINMARVCSNTLLVLIDDILDISKIESDHIKFEHKKIKTKKLVEESTKIVILQAAQKKIKLSFDLSKAPTHFLGDITRLKQIIINLMMNAIKYTPKGGEVNLIIEYTNKIEIPNKKNIFCPSKYNIEKFNQKYHKIIMFTVSDNGGGLTQDEMSRIFNLFEQSDMSISKKFGGFGLGLTISNHIITCLGGVFYVYSEGRNLGSSFSFALPYLEAGEELVDGNLIKKKKKEKSALELTHIEGNPHVLVVEDNEINRKILIKMLESIGCRCSFASDGVEAYKKIKENKYELIFMDLEMPILDGIGCTIKIREENIPTGPIIALSAHTLEDHKIISFKAGMDDYISKPVTKEMLMKTLYKWLVHDA